jgi:hypothetical protein
MRWFVIAAVFMLGGCSTDVGPSKEELKAQWEAQNVVPQYYKQDLLAFMRTYLNDPSNVRDASVSSPLLKSVGPGERYIACVRYNARDSGRKYTGLKTGAAIYVAGKLDRFLDAPRDTADLCKDAAYAPFPELQKLQR